MRSDVSVACRQCGAQIKATPRAVQGNALVPSQNAVNAVYPGDGSSVDQAWAFAQ